MVVYRPGPIRWLWYAMGGGLPLRYRRWVLHDLTCRTWPLRHLVRLLVQLIPAAVVIVLVVPGPLWIALMAIGGGGLVGLMYACAFMYEATEGRATKAGYPGGTAALIRNERDESRRIAAEEFYAALPPDITPRNSE